MPHFYDEDPIILLHRWLLEYWSEEAQRLGAVEMGVSLRCFQEPRPLLLLVRFLLH